MQVLFVDVEINLVTQVRFSIVANIVDCIAPEPLPCILGNGIARLRIERNTLHLAILIQERFRLIDSKIVIEVMSRRICNIMVNHNSITRMNPTAVIYIMTGNEIRFSVPKSIWRDNVKELIVVNCRTGITCVAKFWNFVQQRIQILGTTICRCDIFVLVRVISADTDVVIEHQLSAIVAIFGPLIEGYRVSITIEVECISLCFAVRLQSGSIPALNITQLPKDIKVEVR